MEYSNLFVVVMGLGVVFFGLIVIIMLTSLMGKIFSHPQKAKAVQEIPNKTTSDSLPAPSADEISKEFLAIIIAVISTERGIGPSRIHITNIKPI